MLNKGSPRLKLDSCFKISRTVKYLMATQSQTSSALQICAWRCKMISYTPPTFNTSPSASNLMRLQHLISLQSLTTLFSNSYEASFSQLLMLQTIEVKPEQQKAFFFAFECVFYVSVCSEWVNTCSFGYSFHTEQWIHIGVTWIRRCLAALPFLHSDSLLNFLFLTLRWKQNYPPEWNEVYRFLNAVNPVSPLLPEVAWYLNFKGNVFMKIKLME